MRFVLNIIAGIVVAAHALSVDAADSTILIQNDPAGGFKLWHIEGESNLSERELLLLEASATPDGGKEIETGHGPARAHETANGVIVELMAAKRDRKLLLDRDACSALKAWHAEGSTQLSNDQLGDLVVTAAPDGGSLVVIGDRVAKAFTTRLGVIAIIWKPINRRRP
jgi:hypothetical protein